MNYKAARRLHEFTIAYAQRFHWSEVLHIDDKEKHFGLGYTKVGVWPQGASVEGRSQLSLTRSTARKASCGMSTRPMRFMRFFPSFCFSNSFRLRVMSPP